MFKPHVYIFKHIKHTYFIVYKQSFNYLKSLWIWVCPLLFLQSLVHSIFFPCTFYEFWLGSYSLELELWNFSKPRLKLFSSKEDLCLFCYVPEQCQPESTLNSPLWIFKPRRWNLGPKPCVNTTLWSWLFGGDYFFFGVKFFKKASFFLCLLYWKPYFPFPFILGITLLWDPSFMQRSSIGLPAMGSVYLFPLPHPTQHRIKA